MFTVFVTIMMKTLINFSFPLSNVTESGRSGDGILPTENEIRCMGLLLPILQQFQSIQRRVGGAHLAEFLFEM